MSTLQLKDVLELLNQNDNSSDDDSQSTILSDEIECKTSCNDNIGLHIIVDDDNDDTAMSCPGNITLYVNKENDCYTLEESSNNTTEDLIESIINNTDVNNNDEQSTEQLCEQSTEQLYEQSTEQFSEQSTEQLCDQSTEQFCKQSTEQLCEHASDQNESNSLEERPLAEVTESIINITGVDTHEEETREQRGRKRRKNVDEWKQNIRKRRRQSGLEYVSTCGISTRARELKTTKDCFGKCRYKCATKFSENERKAVFQNFWKLSDIEKNTFYANTTDRNVKLRKRTKSETSRKRYSIQYFLVKDCDRIRVCKEFYHTTLDISNKRVEHFYKKVNTCAEDGRGSFTKQRVNQDARNRIRAHINRFPRIPSHYCRANTTKEYLEADLNLSKMYRLYVTECENAEVVPQKQSMYRNIANSEFNLGFFKPKKDRCDHCEEYKIIKEHSLPIQTLKFQEHIKDKQNTRTERDRDRACEDPERTIVCFDMENVLTVPRSSVSNFFYKRKLNVYNLTAHCNANKRAYNAVWNECVAGRGGNEIASALLVILKKVLEDVPHTTQLTLWSDSCVPQNRNSIMSTALLSFMEKHPNIISIEQKYCTPGHSSIQEVDNVHSHIENNLKKAEIYSPLSLMQALKSVRQHAMDVHQMRNSEFYDFQNVSSKFNFKNVPYTKVKSLLYVSTMPMYIYFNTSFGETAQDRKCVGLRRETRSKIQALPPVPRLVKTQVVGDPKKRDIASMLKFMPPPDRLFMKNLLNI